MKSSSGNVIYRKFTASAILAPDPGSINGNRAVTNIVITIIILNAIIRYLNFNGNTPIMALKGIIKERASYVNEAGGTE